MYLNNQNYRGVDDPDYEYEEWQINEIKKCIKDPIYFILNYIKIIDGDEGLIKFQPRDYSIKFIKTIHENNYVLTKFPRQSGKSITVAAYMTWYAIFNANKYVVLLAHQKSMASEQLNRIKGMIQNLPLWIQQPVIKANESVVGFSNGSRITCAATSPNAVRGRTVNFLYLDEFAFVEPHIAQEFIATVFPTISSMKTSKVVATSCVNKNTWVFTNKGLKQVNDFIIDENPNGGYFVDNYKVHGYDKINNGYLMHNDGLKETKIIRTKHSELESSFEHKYYACKNGVYGIYKAKELDVGDYIAIKSNMNIWGNNTSLAITNSYKNNINIDHITEEFAYFLGLYLAEGYSRSKNNCHQTIITCGDDVSKAITKLGLKYCKYDEFHYTINSKELIDVLVGIGFDISRKAPRKIIPTKLLELPRSHIIQLLRGLFDGDGTSHKNKATVNIRLSSKELIIQIRMLLLNLGILSCWYEGITPPTEKAKVSSKYYSLDITGLNAKKYYETVGFNFKRKQDNYRTCIRNIRNGNSQDIIPFSYSILRRLRKENKIFGNFLSGEHLNNKHLSKAKVKKIISNIKSTNPEYLDFVRNVDDSITWDVIKSIDYSKNKVYDFSLDNPDDNIWNTSVIYNGIAGFQTPNGINHFHDMWSKAITKIKSGIPLTYKDWRTLEISWNEVPNRDEEWKKGEIEKIGEVRFKQEYECEFLGSVATLIDSKFLAKIQSNKPTVVLDHDRLRIYEYPMDLAAMNDKGYEYLITVDPAMGTKQDYSVSQVWLVMSNTKVKQVAVYESNDIIPKKYIDKIDILGKMYNDAGIIVETMEPAGGAIISGLHYDKNYPNLIHLNENGLGFNLSHNRKIEACVYLQVYVEKDLVNIVDERTISQLSTFGKKGNTYKALGDAHDDLVTSILSMLYYLNSPYYYGNMDDEPIYKKKSISDELDGFDDEGNEELKAIKNKFKTSDEPEDVIPTMYSLSNKMPLPDYEQKEAFKSSTEYTNTYSYLY
jgi:hypothetical protein